MLTEVRTEREEQDAALEAPEGKDIRGQLRLALRQAAQTRSILHEDDSTDAYSSRTKGPAPGTQHQPPAYEASSPTIPGPSEEGESSTSPFAAGFSSLTESFKAFAAGFKPKPDPFVVALCEATRRGDVQQMNGFIAQEANINGRNDDGHTPLTCAVLANQMEAVQFLISSGADHTSWDKSKMPPLFLAASIGNIDIARFLLQKGGKLNERNWSGQPFFADVCAGEHMAGIRFLLENGANANTTNISGRHVIVPPVKSGNVELVRMLLAFGANSNAKDISGNHILALAANTENWDMIKLLLDRGANANGKTVNGITVFVDLVNKKRYAMARELLERGADADARDLYGQRVLVTVIKNSDMPQAEKVDLVRALLIHGASPDASDTTYNSPAICHAMDLGNNEIVALLLRHNAKANKKMRSGETLLLSAIEQGRTEQAKLLLEHGADPNATDKKGRTPLLQAIVKRDLELIASLKQHGADLNLVGCITPADLAACANRPEIFSLLGLAVPAPSPVVAPQAGPATGRSSGPVRPSSPPPNYNAVTGKM